MPTIHRAHLGVAFVTPSLIFFLDDPKKYWWLSLIIAAGTALIIDDVIYYLTDGKYCLLCKIIRPSGMEI